MQQSPDLNSISRTVFSFWEVLGELGGLYSVLYGFCAYILAIANTNKTENYMAAQLFS